ncbi:MAG TPA: PIN domain-containing protein [Thermoanaerobaculia bacterium]|nr:PIN domain-containing protein [Thermoanaerobaculia bacterium]
MYTDTSVIGGCEDEEFREPSQRLISAFVSGQLKLVLSELTLRELETAPDPVRQVLRGVPDAHLETLLLSAEAEELAQAYIREGALGPRMLVDALHLAVATVARVDVLVSWNFKHIVNLQRIHRYNAVNLKNGYPLLEIRTPRELVGYERDREEEV